MTEPRVAARCIRSQNWEDLGMHPRFLAALAAFTLLLIAAPTASAGAWAVTSDAAT